MRTNIITQLESVFPVSDAFVELLEDRFSNRETNDTPIQLDSKIPSSDKSEVQNLFPRGLFN